jgi:hypothetical protein
MLGIMTRLFLLWLKVPGLRLGQLIENCFHCKDNDCFYYLEDEQFISSLEDYYKDVTTEGRESNGK